LKPLTAGFPGSRRQESHDVSSKKGNRHFQIQFFSKSSFQNTENVSGKKSLLGTYLGKE
jgi:hypothetical protein